MHQNPLGIAPRSSRSSLAQLEPSQEFILAFSASAGKANCSAHTPRQRPGCLPQPTHVAAQTSTPWPCTTASCGRPVSTALGCRRQRLNQPVGARPLRGARTALSHPALPQAERPRTSSTPEASISAPLLTSALALLLPVVLGLGRSLARDNTLEATMPNTAEILVDTFRRPCVTGFRSSFW